MNKSKLILYNLLTITILGFVFIFLGNYSSFSSLSQAGFAAILVFSPLLFICSIYSLIKNKDKLPAIISLLISLVGMAIVIGIFWALKNFT